MEIILGRARRRWSVDQKRAMVAETLEPGVSVSSVARRHGINANMLFAWRKRFREESPGGTPAIGFAEVALAADRPATLAWRGAGIAIEFGAGVRMTLTGAVDPGLAVAMAKALAER